MSERRQRLLRSAARAEARGTDPRRHKCFLSYHADDADEVADFLDEFGEVLVPRVLGVVDQDEFVDSTDTDYVMDCIRDRYLRDSSVTIVLVGACTWARRYVDWEIYSSLRNDTKNRLNGLMAVTLPSVQGDPDRTLPARIADNVDGSTGYARWKKYPTSAEQLASHIEAAFLARTQKHDLIDNSRPRRMRSAACL